MAGLRCILCGEESGLAVKLDDGDTFHCAECDQDFATDDVREQIEAWQRVLKWVRQCPAREDVEAKAAG